MRIPAARLRPMALALALAVVPVAEPGRAAPGRLPVSPQLSANALPAVGDEFVGPFPSWTRVTTAYGAVGDGRADDTAAIQRALDDLGRAGRSPVLYLSRGTYRITRTLTVGFTQFLSIVGEDPATTILSWDGPVAGTMLAVNGLAYSRIVRLTFDGRRRARVAVEQSWDNSAPHFDTGNEYADNRFVDVAYGIRGGFDGHGFAETSVLRSHFVRNTEAGIALGNFNALDLWVWYSTFEDCAVGVTNVTGAGNFHVYHSVFRRSTTADLSMHHTGGFSARGNYSEGSRAFFISDSATANPATIHLQGNTIVDTTDSAVMRFGNQGPGLLLDNVVQSPIGATGPAVRWETWFGGDVVSIGNTFTVANALEANGRTLQLDDRVVAHAAIAPVPPTLPDTLPNLNRPAFEVPANSTGEAVQAAIAAAATRRGARPIVHVPAGVYDVATTLVIPAGSDLQLAGDGFRTILRWAGEGTGPVLRVAGPSQATIRELQIDGEARADGLVVDDIDQPDSRVYLQQVQVRHAVRSDVVIDGIDHARIEMEDVGHAYSPDAPAVRITGGPILAKGEAATGHVAIHSGAAAGNRVSYDISNGARLLVRDLWYESGVGPGFARVSGRAVFTADGLRVASPAGDEPAAFVVDALDGRVALLATHLDDGIRIGGTGSAASVLGLSLLCGQRLPRCYQDASAPAARAAVIHTRQPGSVPGIRSVAAEDLGSVDAEFLRAMLRHAREERATVLTRRPDHASDVRMFRVLVQRGRDNLRLSATTSAGTQPQRPR